MESPRRDKEKRSREALLELEVIGSIIAHCSLNLLGSSDPTASASQFKMGRKAAETTRNINKAFGPGTANERTVEWRFKKFCKGYESFEDEECCGRHGKLTKTN
ncbi:Histone-lysine N-methyltransferase SETMAR [Plecturocebus cupreus]